MIKGTLFKHSVCFFFVLWWFFLSKLSLQQARLQLLFQLCNASESARCQCLNTYGAWQLQKIRGQCENAHFSKTEQFLSISSKESLQQSIHLLHLIKPMKEFQFSPSALFSVQQLHLAHQKRQLLQVKAVTDSEGMNSVKDKKMYKLWGISVHLLSFANGVHPVGLHAF